MMMNNTRSSKKEKNQHIQVFVRVRPPNNAEKTGKSSTVVDVASSKEVFVRERPQDNISKKFTFDKVFGPSSQQLEVYNAVVNPLLEEVLAGYNCTVFAYGQTGTGKTFTMEGLSNDSNMDWRTNSDSGIIPRSLSHLFDELRLLDAQEYTVRVSFLELYNEELFDLLSPNDDASKIRLYEDATRKGAVIIHGLEEVTVHNKAEVYKILEKGSEKRQTAATLMNAHSSRSHTVFSITVHIKENTVDGEELLKTGKLNLVDLAGSENVGRSGAVDRRAREAGSINQSLLTLGRVITSLVERAPHIPYRESKLTRLLQESLGGRTKTSIIATISPSSINLEETLSTLDYAYRAKNITNRPEINQKLSKKALLKEYTEEIERLRRDLMATRDRSGVYLAPENYKEIQMQIELQGQEIEEKLNHIKALEEAMQKKEEVFRDLESEYTAQSNTLHETKSVLERTQVVLQSTEENLKKTQEERDEHKYLVEKHASTEKILYSQAEKLLNVADTATTDTHKLHEKIMRKKQVEEENEHLGQKFRNDIRDRFENLEKDLSSHNQETLKFAEEAKDHLATHQAKQNARIDVSVRLMARDLAKDVCNIANELAGNVNTSNETCQILLDQNMQNISSMTDCEVNTLGQISEALTEKIYKVFNIKISEEMSHSYDEMKRHLNNLSSHLTESRQQICQLVLRDRDYLVQKFNEINRNIQILCEIHTKSDREDEALDEAFQYAIEQFNDWKRKRAEHHNNRLSSLNQIAAMAVKAVTEDSLRHYNEHMDKEMNFKEYSTNKIAEVQNTLASCSVKNLELSKTAVEQSGLLINQLQSNLSKCGDAWLQQKNQIENKTKEIQQVTSDLKTTCLSSVQDLQKVISDGCVNHEELMEEIRTKANVSSAELRHKMDNYIVKASDSNNMIISDLHMAHHQVEKFILEDLRRDEPTGCTPVRREFQYPRKLVTTSPHERIILRFREARKCVDSTEDSEVTVLNVDDTITEEHYLSERESRSISVSPPVITKSHSTSTPCSMANNNSTCRNEFNYGLIKAASTSDLSTLERSCSETITHSESETSFKSTNKENGSNEFVKPDKIKRLSRLRTANRRVLGSFNN
ncbi:kinesin-like protein Klp61F [Cephus cinctus]|uniref:Kinesin-like protein Klp61F n=1 Tax=Cephus cinctus TaxID=211228 RepID=A0AAJ7CGP3_CEPCN|nr:kinesin-like protein Klp61F [Cephus cinctus]